MISRVLKLSFVVSCMFLVLCATPAFSQKLDNKPEKKVISLELKEKPLKLVAEEIFKQTGCKVVFNEKWNALPLSGQYTGVTLEEFFQRALRKQNVTLFYDEKSNVVNLRFFGDRGVGKIKADTFASENSSIVEAIKDIKALHEEQHQELSTYLKDPESVDPLTGMKLVDIKEMQSIQKAESEQLGKDPETIDPVTGMTNAEIKNLHDVQHAELEQLKKKPVNEEPEKVKPKKR